MTLLNRLASAFDVRRAESRLALLLLAASACVGVARISKEAGAARRCSC